jgi:hypothetical protein
VPQPVPVAGLVLARQQPEVPADRLGVAEPARVVEERGHRLGRADADPGDAPQAGDGGRLRRPAVQLLLEAPHLAVERLDIFEQWVPPPLLRSRRQVEMAEPGQPLFSPQAGVPGRHHARLA